MHSIVKWENIIMKMKLQYIIVTKQEIRSLQLITIIQFPIHMLQICFGVVIKKKIVS